MADQKQSEVEDALLINNLLVYFFQAFDDKDWDLMRRCLSDQVFTDYTSFRDVRAGSISGERYVAQRRAALNDLDMQHNFLNLKVAVLESGSRAHARCNYIIHRFHPSFDGSNNHYFHSYGHYKFEFELFDNEWLISSITQVLLRNAGNAEIHGATRTHDNTKNN